MHTQELIRHVFMICGARAFQGRAPRGNMARQTPDALPKTEKEKEKRNDADGSSTTSALSKRLLRKETDRSECVSQSPKARHERESELLASLIRVAR